MNEMKDAIEGEASKSVTAGAEPDDSPQRGGWRWDLAAGDFASDRATRSIMLTIGGELRPDDMTPASLLAASDGGSVRLTLRGVDGAPRRLRIDFTVERGDDGGRPTLRGTIEDATNRKANSQAVQEIGARLALALEAGRMATWDYDVGSKTLNASGELAELLEAPLDRPVTLDDLTLGVAAEDNERIRLAAIQALEAGEKRFEVEYRRRGRDGALRWFFARAEFIFGEDGALRRVTGVLTDITPARAAADTNAYLAAVVLSSADAIVTFDHAGEILTWNEAAERIFGYAKEEAIGRPFDMLRSEGDDGATRALERVWDGDLVQIEGKRRRRDGSDFYAEVTAAPVRAPNGRIVSVVVTVRDATARKESERRQALLVRELHHRVRNTLATVQAIAGASARYADSLDQFREVFAQRINSLAQAHAILTDDSWQSVDLRQLMLLELKPYAELARIVLDGPAMLLDAKTAIPISMAIHELTTNAAKHGALSGDKGRIEVSWRLEQESDRRFLDLEWREIGGPQVGEPRHRGFGFLLLNTILKMQLDARVETEYAAEGLRYRLRAPISETARDPARNQAAQASCGSESPPAAVQ